MNRREFLTAAAAGAVEGVRNCGVFSKAELQAIYYENLHRLVPRVQNV